MKLEKQYNKLWAKSLQNFENGIFKFDELIDSEYDNRYGITLLARPSKSVKRAISQTLKEIESVAAGQYFYPESDLHLTVLSIISCYPGFTVDEIDPPKYSKLIRGVMKTVEPFKIEFRGITVSPSCILIQGFPQRNALANIRNALRDKFQSSDLQHAIDKRYKLQTAHLTAIRFKQPLADHNSFIKMIKSLKSQRFGRCTINQLELVANDWYQRDENVKLLDTILLKK